MILFPFSATLSIITSSVSVIVPTTFTPSEYLKPVKCDIRTFRTRRKTLYFIVQDLKLRFLIIFHCYFWESCIAMVVPCFICANISNINLLIKFCTFFSVKLIMFIQHHCFAYMIRYKSPIPIELFIRYGTYCFFLLKSLLPIVSYLIISLSRTEYKSTWNKMYKYLKSDKFYHRGTSHDNSVVAQILANTQWNHYLLPKNYQNVYHLATNPQ